LPLELRTTVPSLLASFFVRFKRFDAATMASRTRSPASSVDPAESAGDASAGRPDDIADYDGYDYEDYTNNNNNRSHGNGWASTSSQSSSATSLLAPPSVVTSASLPTTYQPEATSANSEYVPRRRHRSVSATPSRRSIIGPIASASDGSDTDTDSHLSEPVSPGGRSSKEGSNNNQGSNPFEEGEDEDDDDDIEEPASPVNPFDSFRVQPKNSHSHPQQANPFDSETVSSAGSSSKHSKDTTGSSRSSSKSSRSKSNSSHSSRSSHSKAEEIFEEEPTGYPFVRGSGVHTMMRGALIQGLAPPSTDVENPPAAVSDKEEDDEDGSDDGERTRDDDGTHEDSYGVAYESERIGSVGESVEVRPGGGTGVAYYSASTTQQGSGTEDDNNNNRASPRYSATSRTTSRSGSGSTNRNTSTSSSGTSGASQSLAKASREPPDSDYASVGPSSIWGSSFNTRRSIPIPLRHHGSVTTSDRYDADTSHGDSTSMVARFASFKQRSGRKNWCMILLVLTTLLLVGAVVAVCILMFGNKGPTQQEQIDAVIVTVSDPDALKDARTPQYKARQWILYEDPQWDDLSNLEASGVTQQHIIQRYALAVLYYATNGPTGWGANHGWLLGGECDEPAWFGLACDSQGEVRAIGFGTCAFAEACAASIDLF
jgi:hypothetical protein